MTSTKKIIRLSVLVWGVVLSSVAQNQSHPDRLPWVKGQFPPAPTSGSEYVVARGEGASLKQARDDAFSGLLHDLGNSAGVSVNSQAISEMKSSLNFNAGSSGYEESTTTTNTYNIEREDFKASFSKLSEYYEYRNGSYQLWELYEVARSQQTLSAKIPQYTTKYGASALWRSAILPGWGQFYKKKTGRGIAILVTEVVLVSGAVYCESMRSDNVRKSQEVTNISQTKEYRKRADTWTTRRNIFAGGAIGVYAFNLLDAALSKGEIKYLSWVPDNVGLMAYTENGTHNYGLKIKF